MKTHNSILDNTIFFWQQSLRLPAYFYKLEENLRLLNIQLIPLSLEELMEFKKMKKIHILTVRNSLESAKMFNELKRNYIESSMASGRVLIYDVSSFSRIESTNSKLKKISYKFFELPLETNVLGAKIATEFFKDKNLSEENNQKDNWINLPSLRITN